MRVLSGIQPTGRFHWGNYFGAIRQYIDLQTEDAAYYFVANLHALTSIRDKDLKKIGRDRVDEHLIEKARAAIQKVDVSGGEPMLDTHYG